MHERIYYGEVIYASPGDSTVGDANGFALCTGRIFKDFEGEQVKVTITEFRSESQEDNLMSKIQELVTV